MYTEAAFRSLPAVALPEIQRVSLASLVLQMKQLGIADVMGFDFLDRPPASALLRALEQLYALGALDAEGRLSQPLGQRMVRLPLEPAFAKVRMRPGSPMFSRLRVEASLAEALMLQCCFRCSSQVQSWAAARSASSWWQWPALTLFCPTHGGRSFYPCRATVSAHAPTWHHCC